MPAHEHLRRSLRLEGYDYSQAGAYFVTTCAQGRECLFGEVDSAAMRLNAAGEVVERTWTDLGARFPTIGLDAFAVMPNHFHAIVVLAGVTPKLGDVVGAFKSLSAIAINRLLLRSGRSLWQRNYYEHIIRTEAALNRIREYITTNPLRWQLDRENPVHTGDDEFDLWLDRFKTGSRGMPAG